MMPAVLSLPVELLLDVFSLASPKSPSQDFSVYSSRQRDLRSFSLVHRTWTSIAQAVLEEEIWVDRRTRFETSRRSRRIIKDLKGTKYLTVGHSYRSVLASRAVSDGWAGLKYLLYVTDKMFSNVGLAEFARLPSESLCYTSLARFADACSTQCADLETLHFDGGLIENDISDDQLTFHHLRRLTFGSDARFRHSRSLQTGLLPSANAEPGPPLFRCQFSLRRLVKGTRPDPSSSRSPGSLER